VRACVHAYICGIAIANDTDALFANLLVSIRGVYALRHRGSTRCDEATVFTEEAALRKGAAGCLHPSQLLAEIAFKLGRTPKYGA